MKNTVYLIAFFLVISCKNQNNVAKKIVVSAATGKQLFESNNCNACHQIAEKGIGPSLQNIAQIYVAKKGNLVSFLKSEAQPIVDPSQYEAMKINLEITKTMSVDKLKAIEAYIYAASK